jgi:hypothetical protein
MVSFTLSLPQELLARMRKHKEITWSEAVRVIIENRLDEIEEIEKIACKSKLTQKDVDEISEKIDAEMGKHFKAVMNAPSR